MNENERCGVAEKRFVMNASDAQCGGYLRRVTCTAARREVSPPHLVSGAAPFRQGKGEVQHKNLATFSKRSAGWGANQTGPRGQAVWQGVLCRVREAAPRAARAAEAAAASTAARSANKCTSADGWRYLLYVVSHTGYLSLPAASKSRPAQS